MKKITTILIAITIFAIATASYAQLTTTTLKLIRGTSGVNFTALAGTESTTTYTWPQAPGTQMPLQSDNSGMMSFGAINLATQITGILGISNGGTNNGAPLTNGRLMISSGGSIVENATTGTANQILHGDLSWSALNLGTDIIGVIPVVNGGTGAPSLTQDGILIGNGTDPVGSVTLANNTVLLGNAGSAPTARGIVAGSGIGVVIDATNITILNTMAGSSTANGQAVYTSGSSQTITVTPGTPVSSLSRIFVTVTDNVGGLLISAGVNALSATTFTVSVSTDVDCSVNWLIINP